MKSLFALCLLVTAALLVNLDNGVIVHRDEWGVPHIYSETDAGAVFAAGFAQAEDNWWQLEDNFARAIGRASELYGEDALLDDYLVRALEIVRSSVEEYERSPENMRKLYVAYAAGINHFLETRPEVERRIVEHVEPWHTLALIRFKYHHNEFLDYAGLTKTQSVRALDAALVRSGTGVEVRGSNATGALPSLAWPSDIHTPDGNRALGSNEWALAGSRTASGYPMLLINPHVGFFGLSTYTEVHLQSDEGLEFSGLTRFGFMLPYMGNNARLGWSYTDNYGDHGDLYLEEIDEARKTYRYGNGRRDLTSWVETIIVRTDTGFESRKYRFEKTHHGPILGFTNDGRSLAVRLAKFDEGGWFEQWYGMMRASTLSEWRASAALLNVPYMNTMYADGEGNILYIYNHAIPRRSLDYDWSEPVDGTDPGTEWQGYHSFDELPQFLNPGAGFLANTNSTPFMATDGIDAGPQDFPKYMVGREIDNRRAQRSRQVLRGLGDVTLDDFAHAVLDTRLLAADEFLGDLSNAFENLKRSDPARSATLAGPIDVLRTWDRRAVTTSVATTLFVHWAETVRPRAGQPTDRWLVGLEDVVERLERDWGSWKIPWGEINRLQRPDAGGHLPFNDGAASLPVAGGPGWLGSVFTFSSRQRDGTKRRFGTHGNSFVKVVEFTPVVQARSMFVFGQSGDSASPHYFDQARLYSTKQFKPAWFSHDEVEEHAAMTYRLSNGRRLFYYPK